MPSGNQRPPVVLTIAGFDPSSGAGVTADLLTFAAHGCYGLACITALTVQSTRGVKKMEPVSPALVTRTLDELSSDFKIAAVKVGMLGSAGVARAVSGWLQREKPRILVVDPIITASSGAKLLDKAGISVLRDRILPLATVITPNLEEAKLLAGQDAGKEPDRLALARQLRAAGAGAVVITGGHSRDNADLVMNADGQTGWVMGKRIASRSVHGTGCAYSASLVCNLAAGMDLFAAAVQAKRFVRNAILQAPQLGHGKGPLKLF